MSEFACCVLFKQTIKTIQVKCVSVSINEITMNNAKSMHAEMNRLYFFSLYFL